MHIVGFCPNGKRDASNHTGDDTPYARYRDHVAACITANVGFNNINCREECRKSSCGGYCAQLTSVEVNAATTKIASQISKAGDIVISLGGLESDRVVGKVASLLGLSDDRYFVGGKHASTHVVRYPKSWGSAEAQLAACIVSATSLSKFLCEASLSASPTNLFDALASDGNIAFVQDRVDAEVSVFS